MRLFFAIELDAQIREALAELQHQICGEFSDLRPTALENLHLTLKFLGETSADTAAALSRAVREAFARGLDFTLTFDQLGCFPDRGPTRIVWAGPREVPAALRDCAERLETIAASHGFPREEREFHAHVTLARARRGSRVADCHEFISRQAPVGPDQVVTSFSLVESQLRPNGPAYRVVESFP